MSLCANAQSPAGYALLTLNYDLPKYPSKTEHLRFFSNATDVSIGSPHTDRIGLNIC